MGWGGDGYSVHGDGWTWGSVSVVMQTSTTYASICAGCIM